MTRTEVIGAFLLIGLCVAAGEVLARLLGLSRWVTTPLALSCFFILGHVATRRLDARGQRREQWRFTVRPELLQHARLVIGEAEGIQWSRHEDARDAAVWIGRSGSGAMIAIAVDVRSTSAPDVEVRITAARHGDAAAEALVHALTAQGAVLVHHDFKDPSRS